MTPSPTKAEESPKSSEPGVSLLAEFTEQGGKLSILFDEIYLYLNFLCCVVFLCKKLVSECMLLLTFLIFRLYFVHFLFLTEPSTLAAKQNVLAALLGKAQRGRPAAAAAAAGGGGDENSDNAKGGFTFNYFRCCVVACAYV